MTEIGTWARHIADFCHITSTLAELRRDDVLFGVNKRLARLLLDLVLSVMIARDTSSMEKIEASERVWLSTMGYALQDGLMACSPLEPPLVVKHFDLGLDRLMLSELLAAAVDPVLSVSPWLALVRRGEDAIVYLDRHGRARYDMAPAQVLEDFYRHNHQITNLSADDLWLLGSVDTACPGPVSEMP